MKPTEALSSAESYYLGVDLGGTKTLVVAIKTGGQILVSETAPTKRSAEPRIILAETLDLVKSAQSKAGGAAGCRGVGVGVAALVTPARVVIDSIILPNWRDVDVRAEIARELGCPVIVDNDANMALLSEVDQRRLGPAHSILCLTLGTGVGGAAYVAGSFLRGPDGTAGQLGHLSVALHGRRCSCSALGCLNAYISGTAIGERYVEAASDARGRSPAIRTGADVWAAAQRGDRLAASVIASTAEYLGVGLASLVNIFNPSLIVLAGGVAAIGDALLRPAVALMHERSFRLPSQRVEVAIATFGVRAGAVGAAAAARREADRYMTSHPTPARGAS